MISNNDKRKYNQRWKQRMYLNDIVFGIVGVEFYRVIRIDTIHEQDTGSDINWIQFYFDKLYAKKKFEK